MANAYMYRKDTLYCQWLNTSDIYITNLYQYKMITITESSTTEF